MFFLYLIIFPKYQMYKMYMFMCTVDIAYSLT